MLTNARAWLEAALALAAFLCAAAGFLNSDGAVANTLLFGAWLAALAFVLSLGLRLPLRLAGPGWRSVAATTASVVAALAVAVVANIALYRHDVHFDLTRSARFTVPEELAAAARALPYAASLDYFYNADDDDARRARDALRVLAREGSRLQVQAVDLDKDPMAARTLGVRAYNTVILRAQDRRVVLENTTDLRQIGLALLRLQHQETPTICFVTGHGEPYERRPPHLHMSHVETLQGKVDPGAEDVVEGAPDGLDRLGLALDSYGFAATGVAPALIDRIPARCNMVAEIGPQSAWAPGETRVIANYLDQGGHLLLLLDPGFVVAPGLAALLDHAGLAVDQGAIVDPLNHLGTDQNEVAIPYYPPHPITDRLGMTMMPGPRPLHLVKPENGSVAALFSSSVEARMRDETAGPAGAAILAAAAEGRRHGAPADAPPYRIVLVGSAGFVLNQYFPEVANGALAMGMVQWLAGAATTPQVNPQTFALPEIVLTHRQMQRTFLLVEIVLPLGVALFGLAVWWRRR